MGMLLIDMSNLVFGTVLDYHSKTKGDIDMSLIRNLVLDKLGSHKKRLKGYTDIVLCFDGKNYWRRTLFPQYKGKRAAGREKDSFDWATFFECYDQFKTELRENFPYKCLEVDTAEADDLIATLCKLYGPHDDICILSSDKDFIQVQQNICPKVKQWSLHTGKFLTPKNSKYDLIEHIVTGDTGDGVPNILSDDDALVNPEKRQKPVKKKWLESCVNIGIANPEKFCATFETLERFRRNLKLIDLREIPESLTEKIVNEFNKCEPVKGKMFNYFVKNRLSRLMSSGGF